MYASKKANWHLVLVIFPFKHCGLFVKVNKASKMADKDGRQLSYSYSYCKSLSWYTLHGSLLLPLLPYSDSPLLFEYNYELKQKPSINRSVYTAMSRSTWTPVQWPPCTCQQSLRELQWAANNKKNTNTSMHRDLQPDTVQCPTTLPACPAPYPKVSTNHTPRRRPLNQCHASMTPTCSVYYLQCCHLHSSRRMLQTTVPLQYSTTRVPAALHILNQAARHRSSF